MAAITCDCGNTLGDLVAGVVVMRHKRREVIFACASAAIRCEDCGRVWSGEAAFDGRPGKGSAAAPLPPAAVLPVADQRDPTPRDIRVSSSRAGERPSDSRPRQAP